MQVLGALISAFGIVLLLFAVNTFHDPDHMGVAAGSSLSTLWGAGGVAMLVGGGALAFYHGGLSE